MRNTRGRRRKHSRARMARIGTWTATLVITALVAASTGLSGENGGLADEDITNAVETDLMFDDAVASHNVDVTTEGGVVTLSGAVDNILAKDRAEKIAETTKGVRAVIDMIDLKPIARTDEQVRQDVIDGLLTDPATESYEVQVKANDGVVTLEGKVDSYQEKELCTYVAKGVKGVKGVENNVKVDYAVDRADAEIQNEIERRLEIDVLVDSALIEVAVNDGAVTLSGTVGSAAEKSRARADAWVAGVRSVKANDLDIRWWARDEMDRKRGYVSKSDEEIEQAVRDAFLYDPRVLSFKPSISVESGAVTLTGTVSNLAAKQAAEETAENTSGVWRVRNHLRVRQEEPPTDTELAKRIRKALERNAAVERYEITVSVLNGKAYLYGTVDSYYEKRKAKEAAASVNGVVAVANNLAVSFEWPWKDDWAIRQDVENEVYWNPYLDEREITVSVDDGIVELNGSVDTWFEREEATQEAWEGGAKSVDNNLRVRAAQVGPTIG